MFVIVLYGLVGTLLVYSFVRSKEKTRAALKMAGKMTLKVTPSVLVIVVLIGLILSVLPEDAISTYLGRDSGLIGTVTAAIVGAITLIPGIVAFPLAGSLLREGAAVVTVAAFITTLTMVGTVTAPLEVEELGGKVALWRNLLSFGFALVIAAIMGMVIG